MPANKNHHVAFMLFGGALWAQQAYTDETEVDTIKHVQHLQASSLDGNLPKATLEFFLKYEGEGTPIKWSRSNCDQLKGKPITRHERAAICVEAKVDLKTTDRQQSWLRSENPAHDPPMFRLFSV